MSKSLNNVEKFAVQGMLQNGVALPDIASMIDRPLDLVEKYVASVSDSIQKIKKNKQKKVGPPTVKDLMSRRTAGKRNDGVAMMTEAASMRSDDVPKVEPKVRTLTDKIHKIIPDEE